MKVGVPKGRSLKRAFYTYVIIDASRFVSLMSRQSRFYLGENVVNFHDFALLKECIIYIGMGTIYRKNAHFKNAKKVMAGLIDSKSVPGQVSAICSCWNNGGGVYCIEIEPESTTFEAHCRETAMICAVGLKNLENKNAGSLYGIMRNWSSIKLRNYGEMILFLAFKNFIVKRPPIIHAIDISLKCIPNCGSLI